MASLEVARATGTIDFGRQSGRMSSALGLAVTAILASASPALAEPLTFEAALARARADAPSIEAETRS